MLRRSKVPHKNAVIPSTLQRLAAAALAAILFASCTAGAASPGVETDETVYINLDYYGIPTNTRIVKGVNLNGHKEFTDYGNYENVYNMSSTDEPNVSTTGQVDWNLQDAGPGRFYYECIPFGDEPITLPWDFDVSYKLNGVSVTAEECAGANGLVEMNIHAVPNKAASLYYQNNMMLICATGIDMGKALSIDAPGAQIQSMGTYKLVMFMGLPGEENTFTVRIGSDEFESMGIIMCMAPATLSSLDIMADMKDVKDRLDTSGDSLYNGLSSMLKTMNSMKSGLDTLSGGIKGINEVRKELIDSRGELDPKTDAALKALEELAGKSDSLIPAATHISSTLGSMNATANSMLDTVQQTSFDIAEYEDLLVTLYSDLEELNGFFDYLQDYRGDAQDTLDDIKDKVDQNKYEGELKNFSASLEKIRKNLKDIAAASDSLSDAMEVMELANDNLGFTVPSLPGALGALERILTEVKSDLDTMQDSLDGVLTDSSVLLDALKDLSDTGSGLSDMLISGQTIADNMEDAINTAEDIWDELVGLEESADFEQYDELPDSLISDGQRMSELAVNTMESINQVLGDIPALSSELTDLTSLSQEAISKANSLTSSIKKTLETSSDALDQTKTTLRSVRDDADSSTQKSIDGLLDVLQKAARSNSASSLQDATDSIHKAVDDAEKDLEDDTNVLNIDSSADLQSVTSPNNPTPSSLQFIMRTKEISVEDLEEEIESDGETEDVGVITRIKNIFVKLFNAISSVFSSDD